MAFTEGHSDGALNGTTVVTIVAAPGSGVRRVVRSISIYNADSADVTVTVQNNNGTTTRKRAKRTLKPGAVMEYEGAIVLPTTNDSLEAVMSAAATTTNPDFNAEYGDAS